MPMRTRRPDIALRHLVQRLQVPRGASESDAVVRLFASAFLGADCPNRAPTLELLVRLIKSVLALDLSAYPDDKPLTGLSAMLPTAPTVMSLDEFIERNRPSSALGSDFLRRIYAATCRSPLSTPPARGYYSVETDAWEEIEDPSIFQKLGAEVIANSNELIPGHGKGLLDVSETQPYQNTGAAVEARQIAMHASNRVCADCARPATPSGQPFAHVAMDCLAFVCDECAQIHSEVLAHEVCACATRSDGLIALSQVRHIQSAHFEVGEVEALRGGNIESRTQWLAHHDESKDLLPSQEDPEQMIRFLKLKYTESRWRVEASQQQQNNRETASVILGVLEAVLLSYSSWSQGTGRRVPGITAAAVTEANAQVNHSDPRCLMSCGCEGGVSNA